MNDDIGQVARDFLTLILMGFMALVIIMLSHLRPPAEEQDAKAPGNLMIEARWPDASPADVDLWLMAPGQTRPVGYSRKSGAVFNLLRDDLGHISDLSGLNFEFGFSRGAPAGEYVVNLHLYRAHGGPVPVPVDVTVSLRQPERATTLKLFAGTVMLHREGEELTVIRFRLDAAGNVVPGSKHKLPKQLRAQR